MLDIEVQAQARLSPARRRRFEFLLATRNQLARACAELYCWGVVDAPVIDRHLVLLEDALIALVGDPDLAATLSAEWSVRDASLLHPPGTVDWCSVCRHGRYGLEELLGTLTPIPD